MKNIFKKIYLHPLYLFFLLLIILTGNFNKFIEFSIIIFVHEMGHIITSLIFRWKIDKIVLMPFGMMTIFKENLNKPIIQEFFILLMGPIFQIVFNQIFPNQFHLFVLMINLLPIYPLDGSKFIFLFFNKMVSYYKSYILIYIVSFLTIFLILLNNTNLIIFIMLIYLIYNLFMHIKKLKHIILSFCYERYKLQYKTSKQKYLKCVDIFLMYRDCYHYFKKNNKYVRESEILLKMFDKPLKK